MNWRTVTQPSEMAPGCRKRDTLTSVPMRNQRLWYFVQVPYAARVCADGYAGIANKCFPADTGVKPRCSPPEKALKVPRLPNDRVCFARSKRNVAAGPCASCPRYDCGRLPRSSRVGVVFRFNPYDRVQLGSGLGRSRDVTDVR